MVQRRRRTALTKIERMPTDWSKEKIKFPFLATITPLDGEPFMLKFISPKHVVRLDY